jgi:serine phosphatase RsbU (regulator of sigma subunit)/CheY-like chemotaxis protein
MNRKILFVDDEPAVLRQYEQMLADEFDIATAVGGLEGLVSLCSHGPFAVVISDMQMVGMDGVQFLKRVRQVSPNTITILITGNLDLNGAVNAVNEGCVFRLLIRPCENSNLTEAITKALDCYRERREERVRIELPIRVYRAARGPRLQLAHTIDISNSGARIAGLEEPLEPGEIVKVECGNREAPFRVVWIGVRGTDSAGQVGLECLAANANLWKLDLRQLEGNEPLLRARVVQRGLLPQQKPPLQTLDYAGNCVQARVIGGDYYDFLDMGPGIVGFVLADVAGKGIAAALLMASLEGSLYNPYSRQHSAGSEDIPQLLTSVNRHFCEHTPKDRYATLFFGRYSDATRSLHYVNCGHNPPVLLRKQGTVERLDATATVLGLFPDWGCSVAEIRLETGDVLAMYTDGITETTGQQGEEFGDGRLLDTLRKCQNLTAAEILQNIENAAQAFRLGELEDDLTLVIGRAH